jgi:hypothetical protein
MALSTDLDTTADHPAVHASLPCVLDIEASGFGRGSYPIEVGFVLPDGAAWCSLIVPQEEWTHWDGAAEHLHGLSRGLLERHGRCAADVAGELNRRLAGRRVYCDNWAHDYAWLARLYDGAGLSPSFHLRHLRELLSESELARFSDTRDQVAGELQLKRHRASTDARVLQLSVARLWHLGGGNGGAVTPC